MGQTSCPKPSVTQLKCFWIFTRQQRSVTALAFLEAKTTLMFLSARNYIQKKPWLYSSLLYNATCLARTKWISIPAAKAKQQRNIQESILLRFACFTPCWNGEIKGDKLEVRGNLAAG